VTVETCVDGSLPVKPLLPSIKSVSYVKPASEAGRRDYFRQVVVVKVQISQLRHINNRLRKNIERPTDVKKKSIVEDVTCCLRLLRVSALSRHRLTFSFPIACRETNSGDNCAKDFRFYLVMLQCASSGAWNISIRRREYLVQLNLVVD
jgi:hypothetical protein